MGKRRKPLINFARYSDANVVPPAEFIIECMTGNADFPAPDPSLTVVGATLTAYKTALLEASSRDRNKVALKRQLRLQLNDQLQQLGLYVDNKANGDVTMIVSSGYNPSKEPQPRHILTPDAPFVKPGNNPGTIVCKIRKVKYAIGYLFMLADSAVKDANWQSFASTRTTFTFTNLESGKQYSIKVAAIGSNGQLEYSIVVTQYAL